MGKKIKLNLEDLKVQSFVTSLSEEEQKKLRGGTGLRFVTAVMRGVASLILGDCKIELPNLGGYYIVANSQDLSNKKCASAIPMIKCDI